MLASFCLPWVYSCEDEIVESRPQISGDEIAFTVANDSLWNPVSHEAVTSRAMEHSFLGMVGKDSFYISMLVEDNYIPIFPTEYTLSSSRGAAYIQTNLASFNLKALLDNGSEFMNTKVAKNSEGVWTYSPVKYWPENNKVHFLGYLENIPNLNDVVLNEDGGASFSYTLPTPVKTGENANKDALNQPDLIIAYHPNKTKQAVNEALQLQFKHALSAVVFKEGTVPTSVVIEKIEFKNIYSKATCSLTGTDFTWKSCTDPNTYIQTFEKPTDTNKNISTTSDGTCFMLIPQEFEDNDDAELIIHLKATSKNPEDNGATDRSHAYEFTKKLKDFGTWEANKKYTFVISSTEEVEVEVSDEVADDGSEKYNLEIRNTGLSSAYIRVDIRGSWLLPKDSDDNTSYDLIVADWDSTKDGKFDWNNANIADTPTAGKWYKHTDGFYYFFGLVNAGKPAPQLFKKYILNTTPPVAGAELDLVIKAQAVLPADVKIVWPPAITNEL